MARNNNVGSQPSLSIPHLARGMVACRSNARELLQECDLLLSLGHQARAYALLHTACEELAKFSILEIAGKRLAQENPPQWKRFWQRFRSHDSKIAQLNVQLLCLVAESKDVAASEIVKSADVLFNYGLIIRNSALYVDIGPDGNFRRPSDIDFSVPFPTFRVAAKMALEAADRRGDSIELVERSLQGSTSKSESQNVLQVFEMFVQRQGRWG